MIFNNKHNNYSIDKYYFQRDKTLININEVDTKKIVLSNKTPYGKEEANKYYIGYVGSTGFRPLYIIIKKIKLYTNHMNVLADNGEVLKCIEIWDKIDNDKYIKTKRSPYNENFHDKKLRKVEYYGHSILFLEFICGLENKYYPQTFLDEFFEI